MQFAVQHQVDGQRTGRLRLLKLYVDLTGRSLIAVDHGRGTLAHLDRLHPRARDILHAVALGQTTHTRCVLLQQLYVRATQSQQLDLLGSRSRIRIRHIHRCIRLKRLAQVAARSLA